jgi:hypothetical protein
VETLRDFPRSGRAEGRSAAGMEIRPKMEQHIEERTATHPGLVREPRRRRRAGLVIVLAASLVVAATAAARVAGTDAARPFSFGAYSPPSPEGGMGAIDELAAGLRRPVDVVLWYQHWGGWGRGLETSWLRSVTSSGRRPLLTWEPWAPGSADQPSYRLRSIAGGAFDAYIESWANGLKAFGKPVYLRPMHEMNGNWYPWGGSVNRNSAADYVAAWRRMWTIFARVGATNVRWVWSPYVEDVPANAANRFERYYPGARYVDVLALDGYNWGSDFPQYGGWRSFAQIFSRPLVRIAALGSQPIWIAETASAPEGGDKARWVREMFSWIAAQPRVGALVWFNVVKERDWRATSPSSVSAAFRDVAGATAAGRSFARQSR